MKLAKQDSNGLKSPKEKKEKSKKTDDDKASKTASSIERKEKRGRGKGSTHSKGSADEKASKSSKTKKEPKTEKVDNILQQVGAGLGVGVDLSQCVHHNLPFQFFCESCEEPICKQCTVMGPHNNQLHRINKLDESFRCRATRLSDTIRCNLVPKRDQLLGQIHRLEYRIEEIRYVKSIIERDARAEYAGIIERLKSAEGQKVAVLQHEMSELQKDLDRINDIGHSFNEFTSDQDKPIGFLLRARDLYESIEYQVAKPLKSSIDVYPYDLPRELTELRSQLQQSQAQKALLDFKNEVIWKLLEEKKQIEQQVRQEVEDAACKEIGEWSKQLQLPQPQSQPQPQPQPQID